VGTRCRRYGSRIFESLRRLRASIRPLPSASLANRKRFCKQGSRAAGCSCLAVAELGDGGSFGGMSSHREQPDLSQGLGRGSGWGRAVLGESERSGRGEGRKGVAAVQEWTGLKSGGSRRVIWVLISLGVVSFGLPKAQAKAAEFAHSRAHPPYAACSPAPSGHAECLAIHVPAVVSTSSDAVGPLNEGSGEDGGFSPSDLRSAYKLPESGGSGQTVAIVDAYNDPNAYSDMTTFRKTYKLKECTESSGCFKKVNQLGETTKYPEAKNEWIGEISLDIDMVSAICPECHILLVEAKSNSFEDLFAAENEAVTLGVTEITNSWAGAEFSAETWTYDKDLDHPGIPITVAAGDDGYGVMYPAASPYVISVGGTALKKESKTSRGWVEEVWRDSKKKVGEFLAGTGSGCSLYEERQPRWQPSKPGCENRIDNDVAVVASLNTPVSVYNSNEPSNPWSPYGGTSVGSPIVAAVEALSNGFSRSISAEAFYVSALEEMFDVTMGNNGECSVKFLCNAEIGYDGPTGWGAPDGTLKNFEGSWSVASPANPSEAKETTLSSSSCVAYTECIAVGFYKNSAGTIVLLAERLNGETWELQTPVTPSEAKESRLTSVSCTTMSACTAVGYYKDSAGTFVTLAERWNGTKWEIQTTVNPSEAKESRLLSTTCTSGTACRAMGYYMNAAGTIVTLIEAWNGTKWEQQESPNPAEAKESRLNGNFCYWISGCVAVGNYKNSSGSIVTLAENWRGSSWAVLTTPNPSGAKESVLSAAGCGTSEDCMAAGYYVNSSGTKVTLAERFAWGSWELIATPNPSGAKESVLDGVSCESFTDCMATGYYVNSSGKKVTLAERWNGKEFTIMSTPGAKEAKEEALYGVSCHLTELCVAVGGFANGSGTPVSLDLKYD
jgi:hypothetical protein